MAEEMSIDVLGMCMFYVGQLLFHQIFIFGDAGDVPLHLSIRETSDAGRPVVVSRPDSAEVYRRPLWMQIDLWTSWE